MPYNGCDKLLFKKLEGGGKMKRIIVISLFLVISALIIILPYKEYQTELMPGEGNLQVAIYKNIAWTFSGPGLWWNVSFLFVLLPLFLLLQIRQSPLTWYKKMFFILEGIFALLAAFLMFFMMISAGIWPELLVLKPMFYISMSWVILGAIASILLVTKKMYDKAAKLIYS
jgi:hypothetical protein